MCTEQNVTVGDPERDGRRRETDEQDHTPRTFACGVNLVCENYTVRLKGVLLSKIARSVLPVHTRNCSEMCGT